MLSTIAGIKSTGDAWRSAFDLPQPALEPLIENARTLVVLEGVGNADNVGSVFRNAAAFGVDAILLSPDCCDPLYRKSIRTSMAAALRVPFATLEPGPEGLARLRAAGFRTLAFSPSAPVRIDDYVDGQLPTRMALLFGAEGSGLSEPVREAADVQVRIPIRAAVDSLNVGVAVGIALSHLMTVNEVP